MSMPTPRTRPTLAIGDRGVFSKTITEADVRDFARASGDYNPVHLDEDYARSTPFGQRVVHGLLTAGLISTVLGTELPGVGTIFVELHIRFLRPVYLGETVTATATVMEIINPRRVRLLVACQTSRGEDVAIGNAIVVPPPETVVVS